LRKGGAWASLRDLFGMAWLIVVINLVPIAGAVVEAFRLRVLFRAQNLDVPIPIGFRVVAIGALFNLWIPGGTGGDLMKLYYLAGRHKGQGVEVATILLVDRVVALFAMLCLILGLLALQMPALMHVPTVQGTALGVVVGLVALMTGVALLWSSALRSSRLYRKALEWLPLGRHLSRASDAAFAFRSRKRALLSASLLCLVGHIMLVGSLALTGSVLLPSVPSLLVCTLALLGLIASAIPITPGGIGVGETAAEALFRSVGVPGGAAVVTAWRAGMVLISTVGALLYIVDVRSLRQS